MEIFIRPADERRTGPSRGQRPPLRDASGAISGAALVYHDITASRETERKLHAVAEAGRHRQAHRRRRA